METHVRYECAICGEVVPCSILAIKGHCQNSHRLSLADYATYARYARKLSACLWDAVKCEYVSTFFDNLSRYTCQMCADSAAPKSFFSLDAVKAHARRMHNGQPASWSVATRVSHECAFCRRHVSPCEEAAISSHVSSAHGLRAWEYIHALAGAYHDCAVCGERLLWREEIISAHVRMKHSLPGWTYLSKVKKEVEGGGTLAGVAADIFDREVGPDEGVGIAGSSVFANVEIQQRQLGLLSADALGAI